jgi:hypothetical protein
MMKLLKLGVCTAAICAATFTASSAVARRDAYDPAGEVRQCRGCDDDRSDDLGDRGADNDRGDDRLGSNGRADDDNRDDFFDRSDDRVGREVNDPVDHGANDANDLDTPDDRARGIDSDLDNSHASRDASGPLDYDTSDDRSGGDWENDGMQGRELARGDDNHSGRGGIDPIEHEGDDDRNNDGNDHHALGEDADHDDNYAGRSTNGLADNEADDDRSNDGNDNHAPGEDDDYDDSLENDDDDDRGADDHGGYDPR